MNNREQILHYSKEIGFLTGQENKEMMHAHYLGVLAMAEPFKIMPNGIYDFANQ
jgi:aarF domain-containing kinase